MLISPILILSIFFNSIKDNFLISFLFFFFLWTTAAVVRGCSRLSRVRRWPSVDDGGGRTRQFSSQSSSSLAFCGRRRLSYAGVLVSVVFVSVVSYAGASHLSGGHFPIFCFKMDGMRPTPRAVGCSGVGVADPSRPGGNYL